MNRPEKSKSLHFLFFGSPIIIFVVFIIAALYGTMELADAMILITRIYAVLFLLISSYIFFRLRRLELTSNWDIFLTNGYPITSSTFFGWMFLLPVMKETVRMWDIDFLNMIVTLTLGYGAFFFLVGVYELIALFMPSQKAQS